MRSGTVGAKRKGGVVLNQNADEAHLLGSSFAGSRTRLIAYRQVRYVFPLSKRNRLEVLRRGVRAERSGRRRSRSLDADLSLLALGTGTFDRQTGVIPFAQPAHNIDIQEKSRARSCRCG